MRSERFEFRYALANLGILPMLVPEHHITSKLPPCNVANNNAAPATWHNSPAIQHSIT